ncbi:MAG: T9SS type A sorting domain-containing protein [Candidatus Firestonebacteria bacterium]|nr:T9SS type A sorting domain-containing protein [Candidatus Firestonebacteria bacterium]
MRVKGNRIFLFAMLLWSLAGSMAEASFVSVEAYGLTTGAQYGRLDLPQMGRWQGRTLMPFFLQVNFSGSENLNWGIELYSHNLRSLTGTAKSSPDGLYRGLRGFLDPSQSIPLYWQVYPADLHVGSTWGTPVSITTVAGGLGFYPATQRYWGTIYDKSDVDRTTAWDVERNDRVVASAQGLGKYPASGRQAQTSSAYLYLAADVSGVTANQDFVGELDLDFFHYPFDFNTGCYVTPNPVKPVRGQRAYFNFYTNSPDSKIKIKIYDPTGYPIVTLQDTRYWDCRNANGTFVEGGLYIYQLEVEGHFISGTVVVIK